MYYYGYFRNNDTSKDSKGQLYKVIIITNFQNEEYTVGGELTLAESPFTVEYKSEDSRLHKPYKCSMATVSLYQSEINYNFNSTRGNDVYVALLKLKEGKKFKYGEETVETDKTNYTVEWVGFATPNAYSQNYETDFDLYELECQDALSTLQYFNYKPVLETNAIVTFYDIIRNMVAYLGTYTDIYITDSVKVPAEGNKTISIFSYLSISERNFYNEDYKPEKMLDVLDSILQYLTLTIVPYQDKLYIINYDALANGYNYYHYIKHNKSNPYLWISKSNRVFSNWSTFGIVEFDNKTDITPELFAESSTKFSLGETFNNVKVIDDFYYYESDKIIDSNKWIKSEHLSTVGVIDTNKTVLSSDDYVTKIEGKSASNVVTYINYYGYNNDMSDIKINTYWYTQYYKDENKVWKFDSVTGINENRKWNTDVISENVGACFVKYFNINNASPVYEQPNLKESIMFCTNNDENLVVYSYLVAEGTKQQKLLDVTLENQILTGGDYILINGTFNFFPTYIIPAYYTNVEGSDNSVWGEGNYTWCKLECNGKYWNGSTWTTTDTPFKLPLNLDGVSGAFGTDVKIKTNVGFNNKLTKSGYGIPVPVTNDLTVSSDIKFTFFRPFGINRTRMSKTTILNDFDISVSSPVDGLIFSDTSNNVEYINTINEDSIEEYSDLNFSITTYCGKEKDYSSIYYKGSYSTLTASLKNVDRLKTIFNLATGELMTAEEHAISSICRQYNKPNTILTVHLKGEYKPYSLLNYHFFKDKEFVVDSISINYADNNNTLTLVEKLTGNVVTNLTRGNKSRQYQRNGDIIFKESNVRKDSKNIEYTYNASDLPTFELNNDGNLYITQYGDTTL